MIKAQFKFVALYPVMAFIVGAILMLIIAAFMKSANLNGADLLISFAVLFVFLGVILQILFLMMRYHTVLT